MFFLRHPSPEAIRRFVNSQRDSPFSYGPAGATRKDSLAGYKVDHNRIILGTGKETFDRAVTALTNWEQFNLGWVKMVPSGTPLEVGSVVAILTRHFGFWSLSACRVIYLINDYGPVNRFGFAYGTLTDHVERGEERFTIEWHKADDSVWYDILAFSRPNKLPVTVALPLTRMLQKRFARDSLAAVAKMTRGR